MSNKAQSTSHTTKSAKNNSLEQLTELLASGARRARQNAASDLASLSREDPQKLTPYTSSFVDALNRPEAQTRWESLDILTMLVDYDSRTCDKGIAGAEAALFDEDSGPVRLAAMRFLCKLGATTENRSERVWALIDEALQCYHGDLEFPEMLGAVIDFSVGKISSQVKEELAARMKFDAENSKGALKRRAAQIYENVQEH